MTPKTKPTASQNGNVPSTEIAEPERALIAALLGAREVSGLLTSPQLKAVAASLQAKVTGNGDQ
jgi:hypothetical protein